MQLRTVSKGQVWQALDGHVENCYLIHRPKTRHQRGCWGDGWWHDKTQALEGSSCGVEKVTRPWVLLWHRYALEGGLKLLPVLSVELFFSLPLIAPRLPTLTGALRSLSHSCSSHLLSCSSVSLPGSPPPPDL